MGSVDAGNENAECHSEGLAVVGRKCSRKWLAVLDPSCRMASASEWISFSPSFPVEGVRN
jgi:hypothetical protein